MPSLKRRAIELAEQALGARLIRPGELNVVFEQELLSRFLRDFDVDVVFDVGANAGQYAQMLRRHAGFTGTIISFEPLPDMAAHLRRQAEEDPSWHVEEVALSDVAGDATFNIMGQDQFSSLLPPAQDQAAAVADLNQVVRQVPVRLDTVDTAYERYVDRLGFQRPFLKMDTQGNDLAVVAGGERWLHRFVGLQSELAFQQLYAGAPRFDEAIAAYEALGFRLSAIFPNNAGHFPDLLEMDCVMYRPELRPASA